MARLDDLKLQFKTRIDKRKKQINDFHEVFTTIDDMEIGEERKDDKWTIVRVAGGWLVKGLNFGCAFIPKQ
jgi:hypothetical protein